MQDKVESFIQCMILVIGFFPPLLFVFSSPIKTKLLTDALKTFKNFKNNNNKMDKCINTKALCNDWPSVLNRCYVWNSLIKCLIKC